MFFVQKQTHYVKNWQQPVLTSYTSYGTISASSEYKLEDGSILHPIWYIFNPSAAQWVSDGSLPSEWIQWQLPAGEKIYVQSVTFAIADVLARFPTKITVLGSNDGVGFDVLGEAIPDPSYLTDPSYQMVVTCNADTAYNTIKFVMGKSTSVDNLTSFLRCNITAYKEGTASDYDTTIVSKGYRRRYYKTLWDAREGPWSQPILSGNSSDSDMRLTNIDATNFASAYKMFDNSDEYMALNTAANSWTNFYVEFTNAKRITALSITDGWVPSVSRGLKGIKIYSVADSGTETEIVNWSTTTNPSGVSTRTFNNLDATAKRFRFSLYNDSNQYVTRINTISITATTFTPYSYEVEGTADDYDRYEDTPIYRAPVKEVVTRYYKTVHVPAVYKDWTQPVLTSNTSYGVVSASSRSTTSASDYFKALDGKTTGGEGAGTWWNAAYGVRSGWWRWDLPVTLKITAIKFYARGQNNAAITARFYTSADKSTPIGNQFSSNGTPWQSQDIAGIPAEGVKTRCVYLDIISGGGTGTGQGDNGYVGVGEIQITAQEVVKEAYSYEAEGTAEDHDRYEIIPCTGTRYYKTVTVPAEYKAWTQPVLTSNTGYGKVSASSQSSPAYRALDGKTSGGEGAGTWWEMGRQITDGWWKWELPVTLKITAIKFYARGYNNANITARFYTSHEKTTPIGNQFSCSGTPWQQVNVAGIPSEGIETNCVYLDVINAGSAGSGEGDGYGGAGEIQITAQQLVEEEHRYEVEATQDDYDRSEPSRGVLTFIKGIKRVYYKTVEVPAEYKAWTQPVLTSNTSYGVVSASSEGSGALFAAYKALDGKTTGGNGAGTWFELGQGRYTGWWKWNLPVTLKITAIKFYARGYNNPNITARFYTSESKTTPIGDQVSCASVWQQKNITGIPSSGIVTNCLFLDITAGSKYTGVGEIVVTAEQLVTPAYSYEEEVPEGSEYDRYEDVLII